jgi:hypothetical protein
MLQSAEKCGPFEAHVQRAFSSHTCRSAVKEAGQSLTRHCPVLRR